MWLRNAEQIIGNSAGTMNGDGSRKLLLHSTEGTTVESAVAAYEAHNSWPHLTVDCPRRRIVQHLDLTVAARSLRNTPGGADETNRDGTVLVQIELVGTAVHPTTLGSPEDLAWFAHEVVRPVCAQLHIPIATSVTWASYPASYGAGAAQRLSVAAWDAYDGILGHMHAPDNTHGDPGSIDIAWVIRAATEEEDVDEATFKEWFKEAAAGDHKLLADINHQVFKVLVPGLGRLEQAVAELAAEHTPPAG